ncbi:FAD-binding oxidoreductase [Acidihalobacter prosperus]|uniref:L-fuco-beta-pyranose dehydrogenase n=1 Tax=Acidihalobacter prosperus TaxID=160660 RepID=A0A1A6C7Z3_9GAMM|nr:FAD-binding oxidoreductase [Acidihalobacter prosperus]OBS10688.1 L-fuco-beta-pyranose dehydrogenase [Acidihalobacter prosperus]
MTSAQSIQTLTGWAQYPRREAPVLRPERYRLLEKVVLADDTPLIARGCGRSYGDAALDGDGRVVDMLRLDRILDFDPRSGLLRAEAGLTLQALIECLLPQGWFPSVTPGTRHVTLGGCVASDVHGKNHHHEGSFSAYVDGLSLIDAHGQAHWLDRTKTPDEFHATTGGMGLTGLIGEVALRLKRVETGYIETRHHPARDLQTLMARLADPEYDDDYTVAWIDCLRGGRGILMRGHHAPLESLPAAWRRHALSPPARAVRSLPFDLPRGLLNRHTVSAFNALYYRANLRGGTEARLLDYRRFFYPLDTLGNWHRLYGRSGFVQYQCVLPDDTADNGLRALLARLQSAGLSPFLAVLKRMGKAGPAPLGFARAGYTLAMDLPLFGEQALHLCAELDAITLAHGGRVYLAKDACLDGDRFRSMYPRYREWLQVKRRLDPENRFVSALARRLSIPDD